MKTVYLLLILLAGIAAVQLSCKQPKTVSGGGKGGNAVLQVIPEHAGSLIDSCTVYIKYGVSDAPANGIYDDSTKVVIVDTIPTATFTGLQNGSYYIYGRGYHVGYNPPFVAGGLPHTISSQTTVSTYLYMAVSY